jgi:hypothetical protein
MAVAFLRIILYFGLLLLVMSLFALALVPKDTPGFVPAVLAVGANLITVGGAAILLRVLYLRQTRRERKEAGRWEAFEANVDAGAAKLLAGARLGPPPVPPDPPEEESGPDTNEIVNDTRN